MHQVLLAAAPKSFPFQAFSILTACVLALLTLPSRGQDDNAAPPPPDNTAQASAPDDAGNAPDDSSASFQTFYDSLGSQGTWIQSSDYGYVWQPQVNDPDWAPYTDGHWVYTDDGWTWVSDEAWGWATYHYGRWVNIDGTGWVWVPGYTWAPAWVSWRYGDGYCGWAPLPPDSFVGVDYSDDGFAIGVGFHIGGDCDAFYGIGPGCYNFLPIGCLGYRHYHGYYYHRGDNYRLINHTTNVTNINVSRTNGGIGAGNFHRVTTGGPMLSQVNAVSTTPVQRVTLVRSNQPGGGGSLSGDSLAIYAPRIHPGTTAQPPRVAGSLGRVTINHGTDIMQPLAVNPRLAPSPATEAQVQQARIAQDHAPASAKVITDNSQVRPVLQQPLTSLKPVVREPASTQTFNTSPATTFNTERGPSTQVVPTVRTYPQTSQEGGVPSRTYYPGPVYSPGSPIYQPHPTAPAGPAGGGTESHTYVRPTTPSYSPPAPSTVHESPSGGNSSGGAYSHGGGGSYAPSGGGYSPSGGGSRGGNSSQSH
jgi:hypothetical protein